MESTEIDPDLRNLSDEDLLHRARVLGVRDDRPFAVLHERHQAMVWSVCYRYLGNTQDAEDAMQEVFVKAHHGLKKFAGRSSFRTWLYRIAMNTCHNEYHRLRRRPVTVEFPLEEMDLSDPAAAPGDGENMENLLEEALLSLREDDRQVLLLREFESLSYEEIAERLGIRLSAAKMRVRRARLALGRAASLRQAENHA